MTIAIDYTPMAAVGRLAEMGGQAEAAKRTQDKNQQLLLQANQLADNDKARAAQAAMAAAASRARSRDQANELAAKAEEGDANREQQTKLVGLAADKWDEQQSVLHQNAIEMLTEQANSKLQAEKMTYNQQEQERVNKLQQAANYVKTNPDNLYTPEQQNNMLPQIMSAMNGVPQSMKIETPQELLNKRTHIDQSTGLMTYIDDKGKPTVLNQKQYDAMQKSRATDIAAMSVMKDANDKPIYNSYEAMADAADERAYKRFPEFFPDRQASESLMPELKADPNMFVNMLTPYLTKDSLEKFTAILNMKNDEYNKQLMQTPEFRNAFRAYNTKIRSK